MSGAIFSSHALSYGYKNEEMYTSFHQILSAALEYSGPGPARTGPGPPFPMSNYNCNTAEEILQVPNRFFVSETKTSPNLWAIFTDIAKATTSRNMASLKFLLVLDFDFFHSGLRMVHRTKVEKNQAKVDPRILNGSK